MNSRILPLTTITVHCKRWWLLSQLLWCVVQIEFINLLQSETRRVTVVGDDYQAIYGFRGAQPDVFQRFVGDYDHLTLQQPLQYNYR